MVVLRSHSGEVTIVVLLFFSSFFGSASSAHTWYEVHVSSRAPAPHIHGKMYVTHIVAYIVSSWFRCVFCKIRNCEPHQWPFRITINSASVRCSRRRSVNSIHKRIAVSLLLCGMSMCVVVTRMYAISYVAFGDREHQRWICHRLRHSRYVTLQSRSYGKQCVNGGRRSHSHSIDAPRIMLSACVSLISTQQLRI